MERGGTRGRGGRERTKDVIHIHKYSTQMHACAKTFARYHSCGQSMAIPPAVTRKVARWPCPKHTVVVDKNAVEEISKNCFYKKSKAAEAESQTPTGRETYAWIWPLNQLMPCGNRVVFTTKSPVVGSRCLVDHPQSVAACAVCVWCAVWPGSEGARWSTHGVNLPDALAQAAIFLNPRS